MPDKPVLSFKFPSVKSEDPPVRRAEGYPLSLPEIGDDFEWAARDFDSIRIAILEELSARFPERKRWTPADLEVVIVEVLAWGLDQLSDMMDRVAAEAFLETARRPDSVRRLLNMIGYDAVKKALASGEIKNEKIELQDHEVLEEYWTNNPDAMEAARIAGPREVRKLKRMVTLEDYAVRLSDHPLVIGAKSSLVWNGSWQVVKIVVLLWGNKKLKEEPPNEDDLPFAVRKKLQEFRKLHNLPSKLNGSEELTLGLELKALVDSLRMVGHEAMLMDVLFVKIEISINVVVASNFFRSEVKMALMDALGNKKGGFFEPGRLNIGNDINESDIIEAGLRVEGVQSMEIKKLNRSGSSQAEGNSNKSITIENYEVAELGTPPDISCEGGLLG